jgi:DNA-binding GntR family transcriptional regulator
MHQAVRHCFPGTVYAILAEVSCNGGGNEVDFEPAGPITPRSLQEEVYKRLRRLIFDREVDGSEVISIRQLAHQFGVSPMPVREALRRLEADGLVTFTRNKSIVISNLSPEEVRNVFEIRLRLEPFAGCRAADRISAESLRRLEVLCTELNDFSDSGKWRARNAELHRIITESCGIPKLASIVDNLWLMVEPYRRYYIRNHELLVVAQDQHKRMIKMLRERDGKKVESIIEKHLTATLEAILQGMGRMDSGRGGR